MTDLTRTLATILGDNPAPTTDLTKWADRVGGCLGGITAGIRFGIRTETAGVAAKADAPLVAVERRVVFGEVASVMGLTEAIISQDLVRSEVAEVVVVMVAVLVLREAIVIVGAFAMVDPATITMSTCCVVLFASFDPVGLEATVASVVDRLLRPLFL